MSFWKSERVISLAGWLVAQYMRLVYATSKVIREPASTDAAFHGLHPIIGTLWHGQGYMLATLTPRDLTCRMVVAKHGDGEFAGRVLSNLGLELIRGSGADREKKKDKGGAQALRGALRSLNSGYYVGITADMPGSPLREVSPGVVMLARLSGRPIVPIAVTGNRFITLNTWSRLMINLPFSRLAIVLGDPIYVPRDTNDAALEAYRRRVETGLNAATARAYALVGRSFNISEFTGKPKARLGLLLRAYLGFSAAIRPAAGLFLRARSRRGKEIVERLGERVGVAGAKRPDGPLWWFHAASVGETNAILPLHARAEADASGAQHYADDRHGHVLAASRPRGCPRARSINSCRSTRRFSCAASSTTGGRTWRCSPSRKSGRT